MPRAEINWAFSPKTYVIMNVTKWQLISAQYNALETIKQFKTGIFKPENI